MRLTEEQKRRSSNFAALINTDGWRELEREAQREISRSMGSMDNKAAQDLNINTVCEERGYRKGIRWLLQQANTIQEIG
jgi:hypothetical protein